MSTEGVSIVDLYDTAKTAENNFRIYCGNIDSVKCDGVKEYKEAAKNYILNLQSIASSTKNMWINRTYKIYLMQKQVWKTQQIMPY